MIEQYKQVILNKFLDRYENSKCFKEQTPVKPHISLSPPKLFPFYGGEDDFEKFKAVNQAIEELQTDGLIRTVRVPHTELYKRLYVDLNHRDELYSLAGRMPKKAIHGKISAILDEFDGRHPILTAYCARQRELMQGNNKVEQFDGDLGQYRNVLMAAKEILSLTEETLRRNFSARVFGDSKLFEKELESKVKNILFTYGDYPDKEMVLEENQLIRNPQSVEIKGAGIVDYMDYSVNLLKMSGVHSISTESLRADVKSIQVVGCKGVITIENRTTFIDFKDNDYLVIYLGGFSNTLRRKFLKTIHEQNPDVPFHHWGDIDVGGFRILNHLRAKTGIPFQPFRMDVSTLEAYRQYAKPLTKFDTDQLQELVKQDGEFADVARYMLAYNCKLEQEAINL